MNDEMTSTRADMVEAARKFMLTPKVRETTFDEQRRFLIGKGLTEAEIAEARASIPSQELTSQVGQPVAYPQGSYPYPPQPSPNRVASFAQSAVVITAASYAGYRFLRSFVLPRFFNVPDPATEEIRQLQSQVNDLQNSIKFIMDSVSQTTQQLASQQAEITRALYSISNRDTDLNRVEAGISTIKSLLLGQHNFAPIATPAVTTIPSWQQAPTTPVVTTTSAENHGFMTPPANFRADDVVNHDLDDDEEFHVDGDERRTPV
ncbi:unnamed protein product [Caenorhabditis auriculariae]|uniref:Peroxisomal membrane protein PEX14 n=1 Tax=Caenorhabditis auriculariae TaxID=2777116 RepID=A0A8S1HME4_9PELO|nr:unnamed protein product [Caenorhabditis auriculariae]